MGIFRKALAAVLCVLVCAGGEAGSAEKAACEIAKDCFLWARNHPN